MTDSAAQWLAVRSTVLDTARAIEGELVAALALARVPSPPSNARGAWRGEQVTITTRLAAGGAVRRLRVTTIDGGGLAIANLLAVPDADVPLPILGIDIVAMRGRPRTMLAADLSPVFAAGARRLRQLDAIRTALAAHPGPGAPPANVANDSRLTDDPIGRDDRLQHVAATAGVATAEEIPEWCAAWMSPFALFTRVPYAVLAEAICGVRARVAAFASLAVTAGRDEASSAEIAAAQTRYARAHREDDRALGLLRHVFGAAWADAYIAEVLFPDAESSSRVVRNVDASWHEAPAGAADSVARKTGGGIMPHV